MRLTWKHFAAIYGSCFAVSVIGVYLEYWTPTMAQTPVDGVQGGTAPFDLREGARYTLYLDGCIPPNDPYVLNTTVRAANDGFVEYSGSRILGGRRTSDDDCGRHLELTTFSAQRGGPHELTFQTPESNAGRPVTLRLAEAIVDPDVADYVLGIPASAAALVALYQVRGWRRGSIPKETGTRRFAESVSEEAEADDTSLDGQAGGRPPDIRFEPLWAFTDRRDFAHVVFSADGRRIVAAANPVRQSGDEEAVILLNVEDGAATAIESSRLRSDRKVKGAIWAVGASRDGALVAAAWGPAALVFGLDASVVWSKEYGGKGPGAVAMTPDASFVIAYSPGLAAYSSRGEPQWKHAAIDDPAGVAMSEDGALIVLCEESGSICIVDRSGREIARPALPSMVTGVGVSGNGQRVVALMPHHGVAMLDAKGRVLWVRENDEGPCVATVAHDGDFVIVDTVDAGRFFYDGQGRPLEVAGLDDSGYIALSRDGLRAARWDDHVVTMLRVSKSQGQSVKEDHQGNR